MRGPGAKLAPAGQTIQLWTFGVGAAVVSVAVILLNVHWVALNQAPPGGDDNSHLFTTMQFCQHVDGLDTFPNRVSLFLLWPNHYPPLVYQMTYGFYHLLGAGTASAIASLAPFVLLLAVSMYGIGVGLGGPAAGFTCAVAAVCSPLVVHFSRTYFLDMPATAMLASSVCTLLYSRGFSVRGWSLLFGLSVGLGALTKWTQPLFLFPFLMSAAGAVLRRTGMGGWRVVLSVGGIGALAACAVSLLWHAPPRGPQTIVEGPDFDWSVWGSATVLTFCTFVLIRLLAERLSDFDSLTSLLNLLEAIAVATLVAWPWYWFNGATVRDKLLYQTRVVIDTSDGLWLYLAEMSMMVYLAPLLVVCGMWSGWRDRRLRGTTLLLVASIALGTALALLLPPDARYLMPVVVFLVPLAVVWTGHVRGGTWVALGLSLVCVWQAAAFVAGASGPTRADAIAAMRWPARLSPQPVIAEPPQSGSYPYNAVIAGLRPRLAKDGPPLLRLGVLESADDSADFQPRSFLYPAALAGLDLMLVETADELERGLPAQDVSTVDGWLLVWRLAETRTALLATAHGRGWLGTEIEVLGRFEFSPGYHVELLRAHAPAGRAPAKSPDRAAGPTGFGGGEKTSPARLEPTGQGQLHLR